MTDVVPAGRYLADTDHSSVSFRIKHLGLAWYLGRFRRFSAALEFDPDQPERMRVEADIEIASVDTAYSGKGLRGTNAPNTVAYPAVAEPNASPR